MLHPAAGRWPARETADRLALCVGMTALAAGGSSPGRWEAFRTALVGVASRIASSEGALPGDLVPLEGLGVPGALAVVPWEGPGRARVEVQLLETRGGLVPRLSDRPNESGPHAEIAALALLVAFAADSDPDRLTIALGIEGVLAWFRESDRRAAPRNALTFALAHVHDRLAAAGRPLPPGV